MEDTKINLGPESPADLEWSQGAKNPRKENETTEDIEIDLGMLLSDTTDHQVTEVGAETPNGEIRVGNDEESPKHLEKEEGLRKKKPSKQTLNWCLDTVKSFTYAYDECMANPYVVVVINLEDLKGVLAEDEANKIMDKLMKLIIRVTDCEISPRFSDFKFEQGVLIITCHDYDTMFWLKVRIRKEITEALNKELKGISQSDYSGFTKVSAFLSGPGMNDKRTYKLLLGQNESLQWTVIKIIDSRTDRNCAGVNFIFDIDKKTLDELNKLSMKPYYGLSRAEFRECVSSEKWKDDLRRSPPRESLASKFYCKDFDEKAKRLWKKYFSLQKRLASKKPSSNRKSVPRENFRSRSPEFRQRSDRFKDRSFGMKRFRSPERSKRSRSFRRSRSPTLASRSLRRSRTPTLAARSLRRSRSPIRASRSFRRSRSRSPTLAARSLRRTSPHLSRRNVDHRNSIAPMPWQAPSPWSASNEPGQSRIVPPQAVVVPQLAQISQLLQQVQSISALSSQVTEQYQSLLPAQSTKDVTQPFNYNVQHQQTFNSRSQIPQMQSSFQKPFSTKEEHSSYPQPHRSNQKDRFSSPHSSKQPYPGDNHQNVAYSRYNTISKDPRKSYNQFEKFDGSVRREPPHQSNNEGSSNQRTWTTKVWNLSEKNEASTNPLVPNYPPPNYGGPRSRPRFANRNFSRDFHQPN